MAPRAPALILALCVLSTHAAPPGWGGKRFSYNINSGSAPADIAADVVSIDGMDATKASVAALKAAGKRVVCYMNVGAAENWRSDHADFSGLHAGGYPGWEGETYFDVTKPALKKLIRSRLAKHCRDKGFDAVEPDNIMNHEEPTPFRTTPDQQLAFNRWLAEAAHGMGLKIGIKNNDSQIAALASSFDFFIGEDYYADGRLGALGPLRGKAVYLVEYDDRLKVPFEKFCSDAAAQGFSGVLVHGRKAFTLVRPCQ